METPETVKGKQSNLTVLTQPCMTETTFKGQNSLNFNDLRKFADNSVLFLIAGKNENLQTQLMRVMD